MQKNFNNVIQKCVKSGLNLNIKKNKVLVISKQTKVRVNIIVSNLKLDPVHEEEKLFEGWNYY